MSVWYCIPSARPPEEAEPVLKRWREQGYNIALWLDGDERKSYYVADTLYEEGLYPGYARAVNYLIAQVMRLEAADTSPIKGEHADWFVTGGDDVICDLTKRAEEIARECSEHFRKYVPWVTGVARPDLTHETFGVMQPTGHRFGEDPTNPNSALRSAYIDRVAGSPWMGREWCKRANQGKGPLWPEFQHMHVDECLREVAVKLGVYWERPDLIHFHQHWGLPREGERHGQAERMPEHLKKWNTPEHWRESKAILDRLKAEDFKSCLPL